MKRKYERADKVATEFGEKIQRRIKVRRKRDLEKRAGF